jgi:hypothetical protein
MFEVSPHQNPMKPHGGQIAQMTARAANAKLYMFTTFTGPGGSGKSLALTWYIVRWWIETGLPVYSNMNVQWGGFKTMDFSIVDLTNQTLSNCMVAIDEMQNWADKRNWQSTKGRLFQNALMQKRKGQLHFAGTVQDFGWLEGRVVFQIDNQICCTDAHFMNKENDKMPYWMKYPGQIIMLSGRDLSGKCTGKQYRDTHHEYDSWIGPCWPMWDWYDSFEEQSITEPFRKLRLDLKETVLSDKEPLVNPNHLPGPEMDGMDAARSVLGRLE